MKSQGNTFYNLSGEPPRRSVWFGVCTTFTASVAGQQKPSKWRPFTTPRPSLELRHSTSELSTNTNMHRVCEKAYMYSNPSELSFASKIASSGYMRHSRRARQAVTRHLLVGHAREEHASRSTNIWLTSMKGNRTELCTHPPSTCTDTFTVLCSALLFTAEFAIASSRYANWAAVCCPWGYDPKPHLAFSLVEND